LNGVRSTTSHLKSSRSVARSSLHSFLDPDAWLWPDLIGQLNEITTLVEELQASLDDHNENLSQHDQDVKSLIAALEGKVDENNAAILESIRLLLTPQGKRASEFIDCTLLLFPPDTKMP